MTSSATLRTDLLVVGAGPAGSAAAAWAARAGWDTVLVDAAVFPRDKTCGDGLTPRAIGELQRLGVEDWLRARTVNQGLRAHGFGQPPVGMEQRLLHVATSASAVWIASATMVSVGLAQLDVTKLPAPASQRFG